MAETAPTREKGHGGVSIVPWSGLMDVVEQTPELAWPMNVQVYELMRRTEAQIAGILRAITMPIRAYRWYIDPNDCDPARVSVIAQDMGLPIKGSEPGPRRRSKGRFSWDRHLRHALLSGIFGHMFFEQYGEIVDGLWRLRKLAPRMPATIQEIEVERDGGLKGIKQFGTGKPGAPFTDDIPVTQLIAYVNDQEGGNWIGTSWLRPIYKHWLIKDRLLRVDAMKHERNGLGVPMVEAMQGATKAQMLELDQLAQRYKAGEHAGGALPHGARLRLVGTEGSLPDTIGSVRYHDEQMSKLMLVQFLDLGTTGAGNRALGEAFIDFFDLSLHTTAKWIADTTNEHQIEDQWDWNWGTDDEAVPFIDFEKDDDPTASIEELTTLVEKGVIAADEEVQDWVRERKRLPARRIEPDEATQPTTPIYKYDMDYGVVTLNERRKQLGLEPVDGGDVLLTPSNDPAADPPEGTFAARRKQAILAGRTPPPPPPSAADVATARRAREGRPFAKPGRLVSAAFELPTGRTTRRGLYEHEIQAAIDFPAMEAQFVDTRQKLIDDWKNVQSEQIDDLVKQIKAATSLDDLAAIAVEPAGADVLAGHLAAQADEAAEVAIAEAKAQGKIVPKPDLEDAAELLAQRANATSTLMARSISETAGRQAVQRWGGSLTVAEIADQVKDHLTGLSDAYLEEQMGGALQQATNTGRKAVINEGGASEIYGSELLDANTCENCMAVDGVRYNDLAEAEVDYPTGGYFDCLGGPRCRGTLVAIYNEAPASEGS